MKRSLILIFASFLALTFTAACGGKDGGGGGGADGDNPFAQRKAHIDAYLAAVEGAADAAAAIAAGQAWVDENMAAYKANCTKLIEYRQDLEKSKMAKGIETPFDTTMERLNKVAGVDPAKPDAAAMKNAGELMKQLNSFFQCDVAVKAP